MLPETARCCSDRVFYNILLTFPGLGQTKVNLPFMLQHRFLARRASFRLRFRPCRYKDFFKGKGVPPTAHPALSRQRLRSGFVFFSTGSFWLRSHSEAYFAPTYGRHITELIDRQFMHPAIYIYMSDLIYPLPPKWSFVKNTAW